MKALVLSDLYWNQASKSISKKDILSLFKNIYTPKSDRYRSIRKYLSIINKEKPNLVILAGDVTGDGSCGHGFTSAFYYLLCYLEINQITTFFIKGDNDLPKYYSEILENIQDFESIHEVSDKYFEINKVKILGLPYESTNRKSQLTSYLSKDLMVDMIISHSPLKRRTYLYEFNPKIIITGHYDNKLFTYNDCLTISLSNDSNIINYSTLSLDNFNSATYNFWNTENQQFVSYDNNEPDIFKINDLKLPFDSLIDYNEPKDANNEILYRLKYIKGDQYKKSLSLLQGIKNGMKPDPLIYNQLRENNISVHHKLSRTMVTDYLGTKVYKKLSGE